MRWSNLRGGYAQWKILVHSDEEGLRFISLKLNFSFEFNASRFNCWIYESVNQRLIWKGFHFFKRIGTLWRECSLLYEIKKLCKDHYLHCPKSLMISVIDQPDPWVSLFGCCNFSLSFYLRSGWLKMVAGSRVFAPNKEEGDHICLFVT